MFRTALIILVLIVGSNANAIRLSGKDTVEIRVTIDKKAGVELNRRLVGTSAGKQFDMIIKQDGAQDPKAVVNEAISVDLLSSYLAAGNSVSIPEPVTTTTIINTASLLRAKLKTDANFAAAYAAIMENHHRNAQEALERCENESRKNGPIILPRPTRRSPVTS